MTLSKRQFGRGFQAAGAACAGCAILYLLTDTLAVRLAQAVLRRWLAGAGAGALAALYERCTWLATMLSELAALALPVLAAMGLFLLSPAEMGLRRPRKALLGPAICLYLGGSELLNLLAGVVGEKTGSTQSIVLPESAGALCIAFLSVCVVPAIGEELLFRGAACALLRPYGAWLAIWGQAILFALLHQKISAIVFALPSGLFFGYLAENTGSLAPGMALHFVNNCQAFGMLYFSRMGLGALSGALGAVGLIVLPALAVGTALWLAARRDKRFSALPAGASPLRLLRCAPWVLAAAFLLADSVLKL
ncbi:MAG: CPBP family intramembrane metalloprotease [Faecalibacterium sp.]|jgi:membrane protease YdiL (CAAX protease family)|nr:CPBP family intramembrane metalloprotease [Faecalibacterium sp.]